MNDYITKWFSLGGFIGINGREFKIIGMPQSDKGKFVVKSIDEDATVYNMSYEDVERGLNKGAIDLNVKQFAGDPIAKAKFRKR